MALSTSTARTMVKNRMDIPAANTSFDTLIDEAVLNSVYRLWPRAAQEVARQTVSITPDDYGEAEVTMSSMSPTIEAARKIELSAGYAWHPAAGTYHHGTTLVIKGVPTAVTQARIYGLKPYILTTVPDNLIPAVIWYAMSEIYDYLAGNKRKTNIYSSVGGRMVDDMQAESDYFSTKADDYVDDHATVY